MTEQTWRFARKFDRDWSWNLARLLAFTLLESLFAIVGLQLVLLALFLRLTTPHAEQSVVLYLLRFLPDRVAVSAVSDFARSLRQAPVIVLALGLPVAVWYASRFFVVLESALCVIFRRPRRDFLRQNRAALLMLLLIMALLPVIVLSATAIPRIGISPTTLTVTLTDPDAPGAMLLGPGLALLCGLLANFVIALLAYTRLTPGFVSLRAAWPGALVAAALSQGYLLIFPLYVRYVLYPNHFGAIAGFALVALVFFYAYGLFIVVGAQIASLCAGYQPGERDLTASLARANRTAWPLRRAHQARVARGHGAAPAPAAPATAPAIAPEATPAESLPLDDAATDPWLSAASQ
ncbi:MAG TPA: YhjD/YihY/BrkB family envelope integrity protein [Ktedonobacterales bacterium]|nr:YhjD/YihY/BrkB family envelope integrity protein [Ktedonobacterales bacterium]